MTPTKLIIRIKDNGTARTLTWQQQDSEPSAGNSANPDVVRRYPLASKTGIEMLFAMLLHNGAMCPKCGYGTRNTSKNWARCKKCGERVARNGA